MTRLGSIVLLLVVLTSFVGLPGCRSKEEKKHHRTLKGTIESIDVDNQIVTMSWFNEKAGRSMPIAGRVTKDTEIYIDGKLADLSQVRENDHVVVEGYKKGSDIVAVNVKIVRTDDQSIKINRPPASQPAETQ